MKRVVKQIYFLDRLSRQRKHERISKKAIILHYTIVRLEVLTLSEAVYMNKKEDFCGHSFRKGACYLSTLGSKSDNSEE
jgi:hypothetical protein